LKVVETSVTPSTISFVPTVQSARPNECGMSDPLGERIKCQAGFVMESL
jgi:hypothetical protein